MAGIAAYKKSWERIERKEKALQEKRRAEALSERFFYSAGWSEQIMRQAYLA